MPSATRSRLAPCSAAGYTRVRPPSPVTVDRAMPFAVLPPAFPLFVALALQAGAALRSPEFHPAGVTSPADSQRVLHDACARSWLAPSARVARICRWRMAGARDAA